VHVRALGHVVLKVSDLHRSEDFYSRVLGMRIILRTTDPHMAFFTLGTPGIHHDFALMELGPAAPKPEHEATGLAHVAFKIGNSAETLSLVRKVLHASGTPVLYEAERTFTKSVHVLDPDGNEIELYVDV
jgi:catechol 2,3-dioxygenase